MKLKIISILIVGLLVIGAFYIVFNGNIRNDDVTDETIPSKEDNPPILSNITSYDQAVNDFCFNLFKEMREDENYQENLFYSPYSVFSSLAMTYEGARGNTSLEMKDVLSIERDNESFREYMKSLYLHLNENSEYNISTANALWPDDDFSLLKSYEDIIKTYYGADFTPVDYSFPKIAAGRINSWVENKTNGLIKNLIQEGDIDFLTALILTNAIYFKGTWKIQFEEENTTKRDFLNSNGKTSSVDTMKLTKTENMFNYTSTDDLHILELEYDGNDISMVIILPKEEDLADLSNIVNSLNRDDYSQWINQMTENEVDIYLPKFTVKTPLYQLGQSLTTLGIKDAFSSSRADFSGMDGRKDLYIDSVVHKAFIEVSEEGTEAAAATGLVMKFTSAGPNEQEKIVVDCDQPFIYTIHHKETGTILFMGEVNNLEESE